MSAGYNESDDIVTFGLSYYNGKNYEKINITELYNEERTVFNSKDVYCKEIIESKYIPKTDLFKIIHICDNKYLPKSGGCQLNGNLRVNGNIFSDNITELNNKIAECDNKYALKSKISDMSATNEYRKMGDLKYYTESTFTTTDNGLGENFAILGSSSIEGYRFVGHYIDRNTGEAAYFDKIWTTDQNLGTTKYCNIVEGDTIMMRLGGKLGEDFPPHAKRFPPKLYFKRP